MPLESSVWLSKALSGFTLIKYITFMLKCLKMAFKRVLENGNENKW